MASTYTNSLRLELIATGEAAATWGDKTNVNLTNIASAFGYATQDGFGANADSTTTVADGAADPARAMYFKVTSSATLTATRTLTIAPNTISRVMWIENATTGGQSIAISQGTGANVTIATGKTAVVYLDGAGSGAAVVDAMAGVSSGASDTLAEILAAGNTTGGTDIAVGTGDDITFADSSKAIFGAGSDLQIYHDGDSSYISHNTTGTDFVVEATSPGDDLILRAADDLNFRVNGNENGIVVVGGGATTLYNSNAAKLATTATGIDITGAATAASFETDAGGTFTTAAGNDLNIVYPDGRSLFFKEAGTTTLTLDNVQGATFAGAVAVAGSTDSTVRVEATSGNDASLFLTEAGTGNVGAQLVYDGGDNKLYFKVGNNTDLTRMTIERDTGNVGIGTNPNTKLQVSSATTTKSVVETTGAASDALIEFTKGQGSGNTWSMGLDHSNSSAFSLAYLSNGSPSLTTHGLVTVDTSGNVGISNTSPATGIDVATTNYTYSGTTYDIYGIIGLTSGGVRLGGDSSNSDSVIGTTGTGNMQFVTYDGSAWGSRITLTNTGNVGIGTDSPKSLLDIASDEQSIITLSGITNNTAGALLGGINFYNADGSTNGPNNAASIKAVAATSLGADADLIFSTIRGATSGSDALEAMRIDASGNLLLGLTSGQAAQIHVQAPKTTYTEYATVFAGGTDSQNGQHSISLMSSGNGLAGIVGSNLSIDGATFTQPVTARSSGYISFQNATTAGKTSVIQFGGFNPGTATALPKMTLDGDGNLLVAKTATSAQGRGLELRSEQIIIGKTTSGTVNGIFFAHDTSYVGGLNYTNTATSLITSSDERLKENIADAADAGSKIDAMQVRKFDWIADSSHQEYGFVAQELESVFSHAVHTAEDDMQTKGVDYASLVPMLVKEIQSLRARVAQLES